MKTAAALLPPLLSTRSSAWIVKAWELIDEQRTY
jgi:hypothetical protein